VHRRSQVAAEKDTGPHLGIHTAISLSLHYTGPTVAAKLASNILLTGGVCRIPGFHKYLKNRLQRMVSSPVEVIAGVRADCAWKGGTIIARLESWNANWQLAENQDI